MREEVKGIIFCSWREHLNWGGREGVEAKVHVQRFGGGQERLGEQPIECDQGLEGLGEESSRVYCGHRSM